MENDRCKVCGGTDMNLVDGYYYCIECGTQDENVRETIVEHTLAEGIYAHTTSKRVVKVNEIQCKNFSPLYKRFCKLKAIYYHPPISERKFTASDDHIVFP